MAELAKIAAPLQAEGLHVEVRAVVGRAIDVILAASESADAIVMGTHGRAGLARFFLGSVAEPIVRRASVPVITVGGPTSSPATAPADALGVVPRMRRASGRGGSRDRRAHRGGARPRGPGRLGDESIFPHRDLW